MNAQVSQTLRRASIVCLSILTVLLAGSDPLQSRDQRVMLKRFPMKLHVKMTMSLARSTYAFSDDDGWKILLLNPVPISNEYHDVENVTHNKGALLKLDNDDQYILLTEGSNSLPDNIQLEYDITVYRVHVDFGTIGIIRPYDTKNELYRRYTASSGAVETDHPKIRQMADSLRAISKNEVEYARNAFHALQKTLKWTTSGKYGTITEIFDNRGGDCWALTTVYLSLLRNNGIPARYIAGGLLNEDQRFVGHVWPEFFLEGYGWIPVDVSMASAVPFFGYFDGRMLGFHRGSGFTYTVRGEGKKTDWVQTWSYETSCTGKCPRGSFSYSTVFDVTVIAPSGIGEEYNRKAVRDGRIGSLLRMVNEERKARGIAEFIHSETLDEAMRGYMLEKTQKGNGADLWKEMERHHYAADALYIQWTSYPDAAIDLTPYVMNDLKRMDRLLDPAMIEIGIGYYYDEKKDAHQYLVAVTIPRNP
ncbi:MAG: transglutaminase domain-containing protein [Spirochaetes bacterium]|nr:transglutaminase domain-containing protein [Spirochaetota bacterium]